jgi:transposase InsO family protein
MRRPQSPVGSENEEITHRFQEVFHMSSTCIDEPSGERMAQFRYSVIAELTNPYLDRGALAELIRQKASREYEVPGIGRRRYTEGALRKWLATYRTHGMDGLAPKRRRDAGVPRGLNPAEAATLIRFLEENPQLSATAAARTLVDRGRIRVMPSSSALSRLVRACGMDREHRLARSATQKNLKFDFFAPLECVQADAMHAFAVPDAKGKPRKAILLAFLDDATRRILYATFSFTEDSVSFEAGIKHILSAHGRIGKLYADNGSTFVAEQTKRILSILGIILVHSRPYKPQGRGKIERFFRTVREQFLSLLDAHQIPNLETLNIRFHQWLESEYHRSPHRGLRGATPLEAWLEKARYIIPMDPGIDLDDVFLHERLRKVYKDSTITLDNVLYEVPATLCGSRIMVRYDPALPPRRRRLFLRHEGSDCGEARIVDAYANTKVTRAERDKDLDVIEQPDDEQHDENASDPTAAALSASSAFAPPEEEPDEEEDAQ